jgi:acyl-CoA thioesterase
MGHGGVLFSLMDEAFQIACNSRGRAAFALNVSVTYIRPTHPGDSLAAEARELALTPRTGTYEITVFDQNGEKVALAQALAYRKKEPVPF